MSQEPRDPAHHWRRADPVRPAEHRGDAARSRARAGDLSPRHAELVEMAIAAATAANASGRAGRGRTAPRCSSKPPSCWRRPGARLNAATMLGQTKTAHQAEIDSACELIDFLRFNVAFAEEIYGEQLLTIAASGTGWTAPARRLRLRHHAVQLHRDRRQPADGAGAHGQHRAVEAGGVGAALRHYIFRLLEEAGLPPGVINFVPGPARDREARAGAPRPRRHPLHRHHRRLPQHVEDRRRAHVELPRLSAHRRRDRRQGLHRRPPVGRPEALAVAIVRGGFEYQGQKCSAACRVYIPRSLWREVRDRTIGMIEPMSMGDVATFELHGRGDRQAGVRADQRLPRLARESATIVAGGKGDARRLVRVPDADRDARSDLVSSARRSSARS